MIKMMKLKCADYFHRPDCQRIATLAERSPPVTSFVLTTVILKAMNVSLMALSPRICRFRLMMKSA